MVQFRKIRVIFCGCGKLVLQLVMSSNYPIFLIHQDPGSKYLALSHLPLIHCLCPMAERFATSYLVPDQQHFIDDQHHPLDLSCSFLVWFKLNCL